jgi:ABC-type amino acid transport substrate-binding protein
MPKALFIVCIWLSGMSVQAEPVVVNVGGYAFPPFVDVPDDPNQQENGLTIDLIELFNQHQNSYRFVYVSTTPKARYRHFNEGRFDALFFESKKWGWQDYPVAESETYLKGGEVYIARRLPGRDQRYFDSIKDKRLMAILGYHYGFANFNSDEIYLRENFNIYLTSSHRNSIRALFSGTGIADIAVVTKAYLHQFLSQNPEYQDKILVSERLDQVYNHTILVREDGQLNVSDVNRYLQALSEQGKLQQIWSKYGIQQAR